jgi:hypothetical protein
MGCQFRAKSHYHVWLPTISCESDSLACSNRDRAGSTARHASSIAAEVVGGKVGDWRIVVVVLSDVLVCASLDSIGSQILEDILCCMLERNMVIQLE